MFSLILMFVNFRFKKIAYKPPLKFKPGSEYLIWLKIIF